MDMDAAAELLGLGASLLLLGAAASLCVRCSRPGGKRSEKVPERNSLPEDQQSFMVSRTYSVITQACPRPLMDSMEPSARKDKLLFFSQAPEDSSCPRYQNFSQGSRLGSDTNYIDPMAVHRYDSGHSQKPPAGLGAPVPKALHPAEDDDAASYENVLICRPSPDSGDESSDDYQNSASIQRWQQSRGRPELAWREDEDEEPDYVNGDVMSAEA